MFESVHCLLLGHDDLYFRSFDRLKLRCLHCHRETPGWRLTRPEAPGQRGARGPSASALPSVTT